MRFHCAATATQEVAAVPLKSSSQKHAIKMEGDEKRWQRCISRTLLNDRIVFTKIEYKRFCNSGEVMKEEITFASFLNVSIKWGEKKSSRR
jgi:hypothetical protein